MTAKETAIQIFNEHAVLTKEHAKEHSLTTIKKVIEQWEYIDAYLADGQGELNPNLKYWYEVRYEMNLLDDATNQLPTVDVIPLAGEKNTIIGSTQNNEDKQ